MHKNIYKCLCYICMYACVSIAAIPYWLSSFLLPIHQTSNINITERVNFFVCIEGFYSGRSAPWHWIEGSAPLLGRTSRAPVRMQRWQMQRKCIDEKNVCLKLSKEIYSNKFICFTYRHLCVCMFLICYLLFSWAAAGFWYLCRCYWSSWTLLG